MKGDADTHRRAFIYPLANTVLACTSDQTLQGIESREIEKKSKLVRCDLVFIPSSLSV